MTKGKHPKRPREIDEAVQQLRAASRQELAKKEVVQFRMDTEDLQRLYQVCAKHKKPVGTLVREWVLDMTEHELSTRSAGSAHGVNDEAACWVHEKVSDPATLWKDVPEISDSQRQKLQRIYERFMSCRQEELAVTNDLFGIMLNMIK